MIDPIRSTTEGPTTSDKNQTSDCQLVTTGITLIDSTRQEIGERRDEAECGQEEESDLLQVWWKGPSRQTLVVNCTAPAPAVHYAAPGLQC